MSANIKAQDIPEVIFKSIEDTLEKAEEIDANFFDGYLMKFPISDYLIGMKAYYLAVNDNPIKAKLFLEDYLTLKEINKGTFIQMAIGVIAEMENSDSIAKKYLHESRDLDAAKRNKWIRLELFYFYKETDQEKALRFLNEALEIEPNFRIAQTEQVNNLINQQKFKQVISLVEQFCKNSPDYYLLYLKGFSELQLNQIDQAIKSFETSLVIKWNADALIGLGYIEQYSKKNYRKAMEYYYEVVEKSPDLAIGYKRKGLLHLELGQLDSAYFNLKKANIIEPSIDNILELIYVTAQLNKIDEAFNLYEIGLLKYGHSRDLDFWEILLFGLKNDNTSSQKAFSEFYNRYSLEDVEWVKRELKAWGVKIVEDY